MGWWKIDPTTGEPLKDGQSKFSTPDRVLLNAVPGVDDDPQGHYLGDAGWDFMSSAVQQLQSLLGAQAPPSLDELISLFLDRRIPASLAALPRERVREFVDHLAQLCRRIGIHQHHPVALLAQRLAGLRAGIVELAGLADDDRAGADDQDRGDVGPFGHSSRFPRSLRPRANAGLAEQA